MHPQTRAHTQVAVPEHTCVREFNSQTQADTDRHKSHERTGRAASYALTHECMCHAHTTHVHYTTHAHTTHTECCTTPRHRAIDCTRNSTCDNAHLPSCHSSLSVRPLPPTVSLHRVQASKHAIRVDLDDLGGEACLIDWGSGPASYVPTATELKRSMLMNGETVRQQQQKGKDGDRD